ncbi:hypothetical protein SLS63_010543 [Diaporthe eres]|uniref:Dienelactone hydrolase domain-containing protein n=1 Tax=Diaporthe eres TaxID=83184 RepID=A0ABR1NWW7_DIAER
MRFLHSLIGVCGFASAASAWELNPGDIIKHSGEPVGIEEVHDGDEFLANHTTEVTDPIVDTTLRYMRDQLLFDRIAVTGYCFGGRYAFRSLAEGRGGNIAFAAHPSFLQDDEVSAISGPASIAAAGKC